MAAAARLLSALCAVCSALPLPAQQADGGRANGASDRLAERLGVHKNTIRYRVAQAERLLGHPLRERAGDLLLALDYHDAFLATATVKMHSNS